MTLVYIPPPTIIKIVNNASVTFGYACERANMRIDYKISDQKSCNLKELIHFSKDSYIRIGTSLQRGAL